MSEALLYEAEDQHRHDRLEPGLLLPQLSHTHKVAVKVFLQTRLPGECFSPGTATCILPSFAFPAGKVTLPPVTVVLWLRVSQERIDFVLTAAF